LNITLINSKKKAPLLEPKDAKLTQPHQELIVMCGYPASGKVLI